MYAPSEDQLAACLDGLERHLERIRQLDLTSPVGRGQALVESRDMMGSLALCRGLLQRIEKLARWRQAA